MPRLALALAVLLVAACGDDARPGPDLAVPPDLVPGPDMVAVSSIGATCASDDECGAGQFCIPDSQGFTDGYCSQYCGLGNPRCPSDAACLPGGDGNRYCLRRCTSDGECRKPDYYCDAQAHACVPRDATNGVEEGTNDGGACVTPSRTPNADGGYLGGNTTVTGGDGIQAETELAVDPVSKHVVVAWIDLTAGDIGVAASTMDGASFAMPTSLPGGNPFVTVTDQSDPVVAVDGKGDFYITWIGYDYANGPNPVDMKVFVARSHDGGITFPDIAEASPDAEGKNGGLDKPWIAASPVDGSVWVTWDSQGFGGVDIRMARSTDGGMTWSPPITVSDATRPQVDRNLAQITVAADGSAYVTWVEIESEPFGSPANAVYVQHLKGDGTRDGGNVRVTRTPDAPTFEDPSIATWGGNVYVGFVSGTKWGDWDVRVAASTDGGKTFAPSVKVNDDATCATHFHHQIAVDDQGDVHAIWYDNRYLTGAVFHASSPPAASTAPLAFGPNDFVSTQTFEFTTRRDLSSWVGDYLGFVAAGGELYAAWTDPRATNSSHIYFAAAARH